MGTILGGWVQAQQAAQPRPVCGSRRQGVQHRGVGVLMRGESTDVWVGVVFVCVGGGSSEEGNV